MTTTSTRSNVWGNGRTAISLAKQRPLAQGEEECAICRDDVPASVSFKPCGHAVCFACVENMRAKNIFKADAGVKCPFCRQDVDQYLSVHSECAYGGGGGEKGFMDRGVGSADCGGHP
jgi:hypothetical protein